MQYRIQPVTDFSIFGTPSADRKPIQFKAPWSRTLKDLERELDHLDATDVVLELVVDAGKIRLDGMLRSDAKVSHPGVRMSFQSRHGVMSFTCDTYEARYYGQMPDWQANVRAIVLTLESLRAVDRYGATQGEQYAGFKALGAGTGGIALGGMTKEQALVILRMHAGGSDTNAGEHTLWRMARARSHPDRNLGDQTAWDQVEEAAKALGLTS